MPDPVMGERVCAFVVPKAGQMFTFDEMVSHLRSKNIVAYKLPERLEIVDQLPTVGEQKVDRKLLRQQIAQKLEDEGEV